MPHHPHPRPLAHKQVVYVLIHILPAWSGSGLYEEENDPSVMANSTKVDFRSQLCIKIFKRTFYWSLYTERTGSRSLVYNSTNSHQSTLCNQHLSPQTAPCPHSGRPSQALAELLAPGHSKTTARVHSACFWAALVFPCFWTLYKRKHIVYIHSLSLAYFRPSDIVNLITCVSVFYFIIYWKTISMTLERP